MKSYLALFVLITLSTVFVESKTNLKNEMNYRENEIEVLMAKPKTPPKPKGPSGRAEFNEIPFYRTNQRYTNHTLVEIDNSKLFAVNYTYPELHNIKKSEFSASNNDWEYLKEMDYFFTNDCSLARLRITLTIPNVSFHGTSDGTSGDERMALLGLFLDDQNIGASIYQNYIRENTSSRKNHAKGAEPVTIVGTVYNVLPKQHKISFGHKTPTNTYIDTTYTTGSYPDATSINSIEETVQNKVNLSMYGECLKYKDYN